MSSAGKKGLRPAARPLPKSRPRPTDCLTPTLLVQQWISRSDYNATWVEDRNRTQQLIELYGELPTEPSAGDQAHIRARAGEILANILREKYTIGTFRVLYVLVSRVVQTSEPSQPLPDVRYVDDLPTAYEHVPSDPKRAEAEQLAQDMEDEQGLRDQEVEDEYEES